MRSPQQKAADQRRYGKGTSRSAARRRIKAERGKLHAGTPGQRVQMSDRAYVVGGDGAFRRCE